MYAINTGVVKSAFNIKGQSPQHYRVMNRIIVSLILPIGSRFDRNWLTFAGNILSNGLGSQNMDCEG